MRMSKKTSSIVAAVALVATGAYAADGTWNLDGNGTWKSSYPTPEVSPWLTDIALGAGSTANFTYNITANRTVSLGESVTIGNIVFEDTGSGTDHVWTLTNGGDASRTLTLSGTSPTITSNSAGANNAFNAISAVITGDRGLTKAGNSVLTLGGVNTYSGGTTISAGSLNVGTSDALGSGDVTLQGSGVLRHASAFGATYTISNKIIVTGTGSSIGGGDNGTFSLNGAVSLADATKLSVSAGGGAIKINGPLQGAGELYMGGGNLTLSGDNRANHSGVTTLGGGTLLVGSNASLGSGTLQLHAKNDGSGTFRSTDNSGRTLTNAVSIAGSNGNSVVNFGATGSGALTFSGPVTLGSVVPMQQIAVLSDTTMSGVVTGSTGLAMRPTSIGTLVLSNTNTYQGGTAIGSGRLDASVLANGGADSSVGRSSNAAANLTIGGTLRFVGSTSGTTDRLFTTNSALPTLDASGGVPMQFTNSGLLAVANPANQSVSTGGSGIPAGTTTLTVQNASVLSVGMAINHANLPANTRITAISGNVITLSAGFATAIGTWRTESFSFSGGPRTLTLTGSNTGANLLASVVVDPMAANGSQQNMTALLKTGLGTWSITAANVYSGGTTVTGGTLLVNNTSGSGTGTGSVTVDSTATLGGSGTIGGAVSVTGILSPGNSIGLLTVSSPLTVNGTYLADVAADGTSDRVAASDIALGTSSILTIANLDLLTAGQIYTLATYSNALTGSFATTNLPQGWSVDYGSRTGGGAMTVSVVPEPTVIGLVSAVSLLAMARRRRAR